MQSILRVDNLSKSFGVLELFANISFTINKGEKVALIAKNGAGKTTLLNIISEKEDFNSGSIEWHPETNFSYLSQQPNFNEKSTILDELFTTPNLLSTVIIEYEKALISGDANKINEASLKMEQHNLWDYENKLKTILTQLNLTNFNQAIKELSGGQKKRLALASTLITDPDFIILDEPTNHLDIKSIEWLEEYLRKANITLLMVTHDRYFLNRICNIVLELDDNSKLMYRHEGNYENFLRRRTERLNAEQLEVDKAKNLLRTEEEWMRRMPKARGTKAKYRISRVHELRETASNFRSDESVKLKSKETRIGNKVIVAKEVDYYWGDEPYLKNFNYNFNRFDKIGLLGENGSGKSTFLDLITSKLQPLKGTLEIGETIRFGYYRQQGMEFNNTMKVIDAVREIAETIQIDDKTVISASQFLNYFLFPPKRQYDYIAKLSGGEKRRLYLCTILMQNPNFLILDEPTNDLDIATLEVLEDYLGNFNGCVMVVSHDRYFMDSIVDHLFVFKGNGVVKDFPGNYTQYFEAERKSIRKVERTNVKKETKKEKPISKAVNQKLSYKEKREFEQLEIEIDNLNKEKKELEELLNSGALSSEELQQKSMRVGEVLKLIDEKEFRWLELSEKM